jgi:hypothetical protein
MGNFLFTCPSTNLNVQHWRDEDDEDTPANEYEVVMCRSARAEKFWDKGLRPRQQRSAPSPALGAFALVSSSEPWCKDAPPPSLKTARQKFKGRCRNF